MNSWNWNLLTWEQLELIWIILIILGIGTIGIIALIKRHRNKDKGTYDE